MRFLNNKAKLSLTSLLYVGMLMAQHKSISKSDSLISDKRPNSVASAPDPEDVGRSLISTLIPPAPNSDAIGQYGKVPVGLFTGTVQQEIPLYTISTAGFSVPISLNYRSNGIMVSDAGSNVGLGWILNSGGVITRSVYDKTDEWNSTRIVADVASMGFKTQAMTELLDRSRVDNTLDAEPDIFSFNFGNYAGKFYLTGSSGSMQAVLINPSPLKIEFLSNFYSDDLTTPQIKITDPNGIQYLFGGSNAIERNFSRGYGQGFETITDEVKTAWYLTKITLLNNEEINFTYASSNSYYDADISQNIRAAYSEGTNGTEYTRGRHTLPLITRVNTASSKVTEINWNAGKIAFTYSKRFTINSDLEKIDNLTIYTKSGTTFTALKQYQFDYLQAGTLSFFDNPDNNGVGQDNDKRLFLTAVVAKSPAGNELNRHTFDYYNPTELPGRLSYSRDYWGYFNGIRNRDLVSTDFTYYDSSHYQQSGAFNKPILTYFYQYVEGGNRSPDSLYGKKGLLKKITYPTGSYTNLDYEPHTSGLSVIPSANKRTVNLSRTNNSFSTAVIAVDQKRIELFHSTTLDGSSCGANADRDVKITLYIKEIETNKFVTIESYDASGYNYETCPFTIVMGDDRRFFVDFEKGKSYSIGISANANGCSRFTASVSFSYAEDASISWTGNKIIGGMRISKITTGDLTGNEEIKKFYYGTGFFSELAKSSGMGRVVNPEPAVSYYETNSQLLKATNSYLTSSTLQNLYDSQGNAIVYSRVTEGFGNNFEGGAIVHTFNYSLERPAKYYNEMIIGMPFTNVFGSGEELNTIYYKSINNTFVKVKEIVNAYADDKRVSNSINGFRATLRTFNEIGSIKTFNLNTYQVNSMWRYLSSTSETTYDQNGANGSVVKTNYVYDNAFHMQPTAYSTYFENLGTTTRSVLTMNHYPTDFTLTGPLSGSAAVIKAMSDRHMYTVPIEQIKYAFNGARVGTVDSKLSTYKMNGNFIVKDKDYNGKFNNSTLYQELFWLNPATINSSGQFVYDPHYEQSNAYNRYDTTNHLLEVTDRKNTSSLIREPNTGDVWAVIENSTYTDVAYTSFDHSTALAPNFTNWNYNLSKITASTSHNGDRSYGLNGAGALTPNFALNANQQYKVSFWRKVGSGTTLTLTKGGTTVTPRLGPQRNNWQYVEYIFTGATSMQLSGNYIIDELRLHPLSARMRSYSYKDGVGVISESNENNQQLIYDYDEFNRLKLTKDQDKNILKKNEYKFQHIQN